MVSAYNNPVTFTEDVTNAEPVGESKTVIGTIGEAEDGVVYLPLLTLSGVVSAYPAGGSTRTMSFGVTLKTASGVVVSENTIFQGDIVDGGTTLDFNELLNFDDYLQDGLVLDVWYRASDIAVEWDGDQTLEFTTHPIGRRAV